MGEAQLLAHAGHGCRWRLREQMLEVEHLRRLGSVVDAGALRAVQVPAADCLCMAGMMWLVGAVFIGCLIAALRRMIEERKKP